MVFGADLMKLGFFLFSFLFVSGLSFASLPTDQGDAFYEVCGSYRELRDILGPKLLTSDQEIARAIALIKKTEKTTAAEEAQLKENIRKNGVLACTPFAQKSLKAGEIIQGLCALYTVGPISWAFKQVLNDLVIRDPRARSEAIERAVEAADTNCLKHMKHGDGPDSQD
jgi:hypothetical protein